MPNSITENTNAVSTSAYFSLHQATTGQTQEQVAQSSSGASILGQIPDPKGRSEATWI